MRKHWGCPGCAIRVAAQRGRRAGTEPRLVVHTVSVIVTTVPLALRSGAQKPESTPIWTTRQSPGQLLLTPQRDPPPMRAATATVSGCAARATPLGARVRRAAAAAHPACRRPARWRFATNRLTTTEQSQRPHASHTQEVDSTLQRSVTCSPAAGVAEQLQSLPEAFAWAAQQWGDAPAIEDRHRQPHTKLTFRQLHEQITCFAAGLSAQGVRPGDRQVGSRVAGVLVSGLRCRARSTAHRCKLCPPIAQCQGGAVQREQWPLGGSRPGKWESLLCLLLQCGAAFVRASVTAFSSCRAFSLTK